MDSIRCLSNLTNQLTMKKSVAKLGAYAALTILFILVILIANQLLEKYSQKNFHIARSRDENPGRSVCFIG